VTEQLNAPSDRGVLGAKRVPFSEIPVIDVGPLLAGEPSAVARVAEEIGRACRNVGFFYIRNHGIAAEKIDRLVSETKRFYALPMAARMAYDIERVQRHRGYVPMGALYADVGAEPDIQEGYEVSVELPADDPDYLAGNIMLGPNLWPSELPGFREGVYDYHQAAVALGRVLFRAFARALGVAEDFFDDKTDKPMAQLRLLHYPPQQGKIRAKRIGVGIHTDYECFTILLQTAAGLQVRNTAGDWIEAPPIPGTLVINIGDMLMRWTNGEFASTPHRAVNVTGEPRFSFPLFFGANYDAIARPLPKFCSPERPPRYPPTKCGPWTVKNITEVYEYRRAYRDRIENPELKE
jgi:isopenicillin N synthase-like dioxygenase